MKDGYKASPRALSPSFNTPDSVQLILIKTGRSIHRYQLFIRELVAPVTRPTQTKNIYGQEKKED